MSTEQQPSIEPVHSGPSESTATTPAPIAKKSQRMFALGIGLLVLVAVGGSIAFATYRVYKQAASDKFTVAFASALHFPAFKVNDRTVSYSSYLDDMQAIHHMQSYTTANGGTNQSFTESQLSDQVIQRLVQDALIAQVAQKYGVSVSSNDLEAYKNSILSQRGVTTTAEADKVLQSMYGWNLATYAQKVMEPVLLYQKVSSKIQDDAAVQSQVKQYALQRAQTILASIKNDDDFTKMAALYGEDGTAQNGGDLGWFSRGDMQADFEKAAFALKKGEMVTAPVESPFGFHIIKVDDRRINKVKDPKTGKMVDQEQIKARHILITAGLDKYLEMLLKQSDFHFYIPVHNPFANK